MLSLVEHEKSCVTPGCELINTSISTCVGSNVSSTVTLKLNMKKYVCNWMSPFWLTLDLFFIVRKRAKITNRYNQAPHLTQDTTWQTDKNTIKHHKQEPRGQPFPSRWPQGSNEQTRQFDQHKTWITQMIQKRRTALEGSLKYFTGGLKIVSEYDQEIPQSQTADKPVAPRGRAAQPSRDTRKIN